MFLGGPETQGSMTMTHTSVLVTSWRGSGNPEQAAGTGEGKSCIVVWTWARHMVPSGFLTIPSMRVGCEGQ